MQTCPFGEVGLRLGLCAKIAVFILKAIPL